MQLLLKQLTSMANSVDPDQTAPEGAGLIWVYTVCICNFVRNIRKHMRQTKAGLNSGVVLISRGRINCI